MSVSITDKTSNPLVIQAGGSLGAFKAISSTGAGALTDTETVTISLNSYYNYYGLTSSVGTITDPNGGGTFSTGNDTGSFTESGLVAGSPDFASTVLSRLVYDAPALPAGQSLQVQGTVSVTDNGRTTTDPTPLIIDVVTPPSITGTAANEPVVAGDAISPFASAQITDNALFYTATDIATITITDGGTATDADGLLTGAGLSKTGVGTYSVIGTSPWQLTSYLQKLSFATTAGKAANPSFALTVTDAGTGLAATDTTTSVLIIPPAPDTPPVIAGTAAGQTVADGNSIDPFHGVTVSDGNANPSVTATITVTNSAGTPTDADGTFAAATWLTHDAGSGVYTLAAASPAALTSELDQLAFTPAGLPSGQSSVNTGFKLDVTDAAAGTTATDTTTSVTETAPPAPPAVSQSNANFVVVDQTTGQSYASAGQPYSGPVPGVTNEFVLLGSDNVSVTAQVANVFIETGFIPGQQTEPLVCGINTSVANGNNVLDGYANSNFLTGGTGTDQFYDDVRTLSQNSWSTVVNLHSGDNVTIWGVTAADFTLDWIGDTYGAGGATGLTGVFVPKAGGTAPEAAITLAGFKAADLTDGKLSFGYNTVGGVPYFSVHAT